MVKYTGSELMEGLKKRKRPSKKKEPKVQEEVGILHATPSEELVTTEVPSAPTGVQGEVDMTTMPTEVWSMVEAPIGRGSPSWDAEASQPAPDILVPEVDEGDKF